MVIFAQHDLVKNPPYCNMHFISCRNLLIYMTSVLQKKIFTMLLFGLKKDGYLFLGPSENPMPISKSLDVVNKKWKIYRNLETKRGVSFDAFSLPDLLDIKRTPPRPQSETSLKTIDPAFAEALQGRLAKDLDYLAVCVNESNQVVSSYGDTSRYLLQKHFTLDLIALLPRPLVIAFNILSTEVTRTNEIAARGNIKIRQADKVTHVNLSVSPLEIKAEHRLLLVVFTTSKDQHLASETLFEEQAYAGEYTRNLEDEIKELKEKLRYSYERLDASNENMQSFNEELISANEEMQSTNEEMQSVNEELHTINTEYQLKNKELLETNDDLNNYFRSNINGQIFINNDMELMKFSPGTVKQINLLDSDIGRPLSNISTNIKFETIIDDVKKVLSEDCVVTKEIETNNGKWYQIMTMPYVEQSKNKNNGAIITFNDITELKSSKIEIEKKNKTLQRINADLDHFIHAASHDLLGPLGNIETSINIMNRITLSDQKLMEFLDIINISVKKFRELITDIASIAKVEGDMMHLEMVNIDDTINNIIWSLENKIQASGAVITRNLGVSQILFSKKNLRSIVYNLISNAIKFKRDVNPVINITTRTEDDHIMLSVQDNGKGIPRKGIEKIFSMYGRLNQDIEGQGIGLYLAKKIVNAAGGSIVVDSEPGTGTTFKIFLKIEAEQLEVSPFLN